MISYVTLGVRDIAAARKFYGDLLGELGAKTLLNMDRITFFGKSMKEPMLAVCIPFNQEAAAPGNGNMVSMAPGSKEAVDALYHKAIALGATCDGAADHPARIPAPAWCPQRPLLRADAVEPADRPHHGPSRIARGAAGCGHEPALWGQISARRLDGGRRQSRQDGDVVFARLLL